MTKLNFKQLHTKAKVNNKDVLCLGNGEEIDKIKKEATEGHCSLFQHFVVGDTFPLGCAFSDSIVFPEFFKENPDYRHPVYR